MKTLITILIAAMLLVVASPVIAENKVGISYTDSYNWYGFKKVFGDEYVHTGASTTVQGFDISATTHVRDLDDIEFWDAAVAYKLPLELPVNLTAGYGYMEFPGMKAQEFSMTAQLPGTIAPRYTLAHIEPDGGQFHVLGLDVALGEPESISAMLSADITYNDGVFEIRDWTHVTAGIVLDVPLGPVSLQPGIWYQYAFEPEALQCDESEFWYGIGVFAKF